jgi:hypothetical protein
MTSAKARAFATSIAVLTATLILAASATPAAAKKRKEEPPPPPPVEQTVEVGPPALAGYVVEQASAYASYMRKASAISPTFTNGPSVGDALRLGAHSEQHQLQQGVVAYAAIVALQDPTFVKAVREFASHPSQRETVAGYILANPNYVMTLVGHETAAGLIVATLGDQAAHLKTIGDKVKQESLDIQLKSSWSKKAVPGPDQRLRDIKQLSASPITGDDDLKAQLAQASTGAGPMPLAGSPVAPPYNQAVVRGMALAALAILGKAGDGNMDYVMPLLVNDGDGYCFNMSKLNLYQCLSVARPYYEDIYCLGLHALDDTADCVSSEIGHPSPAAPTPIATDVTPTPDPPAASLSPGRL